MKCDTLFDRDFKTDLKKAVLLLDSYNLAGTPEEKSGFLNVMDFYIQTLNDPSASAIFSRVADLDPSHEDHELFIQILQEYLYRLREQIGE